MPDPQRPSLTNRPPDTRPISPRPSERSPEPPPWIEPVIPDRTWQAEWYATLERVIGAVRGQPWSTL